MMGNLHKNGIKAFKAQLEDMSFSRMSKQITRVVISLNLYKDK